MRDTCCNAELLTSLELRALTVNRFGARCIIRTREIHEVTVVAHDAPALFKHRARARCTKRRHLVCFKRRRYPHALIACENLQATEVQRLRFFHRKMKPARDGKMCANPQRLRSQRTR